MYPVVPGHEIAGVVAAVGPAAVRGHHHVLAAPALRCGSRQEGRRHRLRRTRPHGREVRPRHGRRGDRAVAVAEEARQEPSAQPVFRSPDEACVLRD
ncbi:hypothetical protein C4B68_08375 [Streptomyces dengpaensis]|uniref:Alcohol dehydrogenase-like N-terminal domain-containing protein n=1 Tax=Streptomyces dengpaensis TaxID=2049881 RepID=A0ABM6SM97_9ACTN|nr:hypothetical protein C4B68_08375 [Streptomyces dengpaensis]